MRHAWVGAALALVVAAPGVASAAAGQVSFLEGKAFRAPGGDASAGLMTLTGNYAGNGNGSTMSFDLGGTTSAAAFAGGAGTFDNITVSGATALNDVLSVNLLAGFTPANSDTFTILASTGPLTGAFSNVAFGGTVAALAREAGARHGDPARYDTHEHEVRLLEGGFLAGLYSTNDGVVCSAHRQGIDRLGNGLRIDAIATDGCVEAFVADARGVALGVQWHPEFDDAVRGRLDGRRLFDAFVQASRATQRT